MKKRYLLLLLLIPIIFFFLREKKDSVNEFDCIKYKIPFDYTNMDSLKLRLENCFSEKQFTLEAYCKIEEQYKSYDFQVEEFRNAESVPEVVEYAYTKKPGKWPKANPKKKQPFAGVWKTLSGDSIYLIVYYDL